MAFRESGKSTIMNTANALWSILGKPEKKFVLIMSKTQEQAKSHFANIKSELEENELLRQDFGPFTESGEPDNKLSFELVYHGAKIMSVTREQSLRGLKYGQHRPDLIICDDMEDSDSIADKKDSKALHERFESEIIPLGSDRTKVIVLGNLLCTFRYDPWPDYDSLILLLRKNILAGKIRGIFRAYPLIDRNGKNLWPGRFVSREAVQEMRDKVPWSVWEREYLLKTSGQGGEQPGISFLHYDRQQTMKYVKEYGWYPGESSHTMPQIPLIESMKEFHIEAPAHVSAHFASPDDPGYKKYLEDFYVGEIDMPTYFM